ncbi:uncharacterized protein LOC141910812 isoform X2 [Tubulanus polymorphus]|uniref:uncharacterized protein LOC141910812 isoform X2 n=1 Tax=Tubulanus polymorphus TaxID=672921 RepID=UPI003DA27F72
MTFRPDTIQSRYDFLDVSPRSDVKNRNNRLYDDDDLYLADGRATARIDKLLLDSSRQPNPLYDGTDKLRLRPDILAKLEQKIYLPKQMRYFFGLDRAKNLASLSYDESVPRNIKYKEQGLVEQVLEERTQAYEKNHEIHQQKLKQLNEQRDVLVQARNEVKKHLRKLAKKPPTPPFSDDDDDADRKEEFDEEERRAPSAESVHSISSIIQRTKIAIPRQNWKYKQLRELHSREMTRLRKLHEPYRGELGVESYESWQIHDYEISRGIVEDLVDSFLDTYFKPAITAESKDAQIALIEAEQKQMDLQWKALQHEKLVQLISEEQLLHVTRELAVEACKEFLYISSMATHMSNLLVMRQAEHVTTNDPSGRDPNDSLFPVVTNGYFQATNLRDRQRADVYAHCQHLTYVAADDEDALVVDDDDQDAETIDYDRVVPVELLDTDSHPYDSPDEKLAKERLDRYRRKELQYWSKLTARVFSLTLNSRPSRLQASPSARYLAVATIKGDLFVYDLHKQPWQPVRIYREQQTSSSSSKLSSAISEIAWSLDEAQIITINDGGLVNVWGFQTGLFAPSAAQETTTSAAVPATALKSTKDDLGARVPVPLAQISMDKQKQALVFNAGPFAEIRVHDELYSPCLAQFHTCLSLMGVQRSICLSLENGDVLKCELEKRLYAASDGFTESTRILDENLRTSVPSHIAAEVETELLRAHKYPLIHIGVVCSTQNLFTLDNKGFLFVWRYSSLEVTEYGWLQPHRKFRIDLTKVMYEPQETAKPNIIFSDKLSSKPRTRQQIVRERQTAQEELDRAHLVNPWHQEYVADRDLMTRIYRPDEQITESGGLFHVTVKHHSTNQLATYITRVYKPIRVKSTRFYGSRQTADGRFLILLLLFPTHLPKRSHLTILKLDLESFRMTDYRKDIFLTDNEYESLRTLDIVDWEISLCYATTGAEYLFLNKNGDLTAYSLNTGLKVLKLVAPKQRTADAGFVGCRLNTQVVQMVASHKLSVTGTNGQMYLIYHNKDSSSLRVLEFVDKNEDVDRRNMWKIYEAWSTASAITPPQHRVTINETYLGDETEHPFIFCRNVVNSILDFVVEFEEGPFTPAQKTAHSEIDRVENYRLLLLQVPQPFGTPTNSTAAAGAATTVNGNQQSSVAGSNAAQQTNSRPASNTHNISGNATPRRNTPRATTPRAPPRTTSNLTPRPSNNN